MELKRQLQSLRVTASPVETASSEAKDCSSHPTSAHKRSATDKNAVLDQFKEINDHLAFLEDRAKERAIQSQPQLKQNSKPKMGNQGQSFISRTEDDFLESFVKTDMHPFFPPHASLPPLEPKLAPDRPPELDHRISIHEVDCGKVFDPTHDPPVSVPPVVSVFSLSYSPIPIPIQFHFHPPEGAKSRRNMTQTQR
jgi:hypothetical protein